MADPHAMLALCAPICWIGILLQSLELVWNWRHLRDGHLLGWGRRPAAPDGPVMKTARWLLRYPACLALLCARAGAAAACLLLSYEHAAAFWILGLLVLLQLYYNRRFSMTRENANAMYLYCLVSLFVGAWPAPSERLVCAALTFVAFQAVLAYFVTGKNKLASPLWRNGVYLTRVFQGQPQLFPRLGPFLAHHRRVAILATWSVILLEVLFPVCLFLPSSLFWIFIAGGLVFHAAVSVTMGPHAFWWSFVATYPALYFVHHEISLGLYGLP